MDPAIVPDPTIKTGTSPDPTAKKEDPNESNMFDLKNMKWYVWVLLLIVVIIVTMIVYKGIDLLYLRKQSPGFANV